MSFFKKLCESLKNPTSLIGSIKLRYYKIIGRYDKVNDIKYYKTFGKYINWDNPEDLNQWIHWLMFKTDISSWSDLADKYKVREYVKNKGLDDILVPLLGVWDAPEKINFESLPNQFVMKMNNGCADAKIVKDKTKEDLEKLRKYFSKKFKFDYGTKGEIHYSKIKPKIIAEELLDINKQDIESSSMADYKLWCFNGKVDNIMICTNRKSHSLNMSFYDSDWNYRPDIGQFNSHYVQGKPFPAPKNAQRMISIAEKLSEGFPQVRVDLYEIDGKVYFGELTFTSLMGRMNYFHPQYLKHLGALCKNAYIDICSKKTRT